MAFENKSIFSWFVLTPPAAGGDDGKTASATLDVFNSSAAAGGGGATFSMDAPLRDPRVACLGERYVLVACGVGVAACNTKVYVLDTQAMPAAHATLPVLPTPLAAKKARIWPGSAPTSTATKA